MSDTSSGFGIEYAGKLVYCEAFMKENEHEVYFDGIYVASVTINDNFDWMQTAGSVLPQTTIDEIGRRIENRYE